MDNKHTMVISIMDRDRPGIVAEVTEGISVLGGNLADLRESVLCGYFTMILVATFSSSVTAGQVEQVLAKDGSLRVSVELVREPLSEREDNAGHTYVLSAVGKDRVGLVAQVSRFCCDRQVNILDLASHVEDDQYTMMLQLDLASVQSVEKFTDELSGFGESSGLNLVLQHNDIFRATNEI
jgi:glycine cleavage system transcriptional repressor